MAPTQWTRLHDRLLDFMYKEECYEESKEIMRVLSKYANNSLNAFNINESNLLFESFWMHNLPFMKLLLEAEADPCIADRDGSTLLHLMAGATCKTCCDEEIEEFPDLQVTRHLLELYKTMDCVLKTRSVNAQDNDGISPLMAAAKSGNYNMAKWLLENGADVNAKTFDGWTTAVNIAARKGNQDMLRLLLNIAPAHVYASDVRVRRELINDNGNKDIIGLLDTFSLQE